MVTYLSISENDADFLAGSLTMSGLNPLFGLMYFLQLLEICYSGCLHSKRLCCKVNLILSGDVNLIGAFNLAGAVKGFL